MSETSPLINSAPTYYTVTDTPSDDFHCHDDSGEVNNSGNAKAKRILWISVCICLLFMLAEVVGGLLANSLAIVTDAAHLLTDFASMLISLFSLYIAGRKPSQKMSFGFHRAEVLGAFFSVFLIWIVTGVLVVMAVMRIVNGNYEVDAPIMAITAALGVLVNLIMGALLYFGGHTHSHGGGGHNHGHSHSHSHDEESSSTSSDSADRAQNINVRAAFIHVLGDLIQSIGVLIAALLIYFVEGWEIVDPICTLLFSVIVLCTTIYILRDAMVVLLEGRPNTIDFSAVFSSLEQIEGVRKVHDLRIWALTMDKVAVSVHLEVEDPAACQSVLRTTRSMLRRNFNVHESTVQIEPFRAGADCGKCELPK